MNYNGFDKESVDAYLEQVRLGEIEIVQIFINQIRDILIVKNEFGNSALHYACGNCHVEMVRMLLEYPEIQEIINDKNTQGNTPLHWVVGAPIELLDGIKEDHLVEMTNLLLQKGADKNIENDSQQTPLLIAIQKHREHIVELLMDPIPDDYELDNEKEIIIDENELKQEMELESNESNDVNEMKEVKETKEMKETNDIPMEEEKEQKESEN